MESEGASLAERSDALIVATPRQAKLQAIVLIEKSEPMADRSEAIRNRQRILSLVRKVEDGRAEDGPIAVEENAASQAQFFLVAQILDVRVDVSVETEIA